jgi:thiol-disulfide isomerase/thioredoxin
MERINPSIDFDRRFWREDILGSKAHAEMLVAQGILTAEDGAAIAQGLDDIWGEIESGTFKFSRALEDIHLNVESRLREKIGEAAGRLHTGRSRNDQVATDMKLWTRGAIDALDAELKDLQAALIAQADRHADTIMPGFTHLQPAPSIDFLDPDGERINLDAYRGQTVLVNFWATWCAPCIKELPALDALQGDLGGEDFRVLIISIDRKGLEVAQPFLDGLDVRHLKTAADPKGALARAMQATGLPTTVIVAPDGKVMGRILGDAEWNSDGAKALVRYYLQ